MPPSSVEKEGAGDRWPVLTLEFSNVSKHYRDMDPEDGFAHDPSEFSRYYPADHACVLSPEEARVLSKFYELGWDALTAGECDVLRSLVVRISTWAEGEETK